MNEILRGIVGSTAYGLATPESDVDHLGVFLAPTIDFLGLKKVTESVVTHEPEDFSSHELGKFVRLCLANNPTVMELLWLDDYEVISDVGIRLIGLRNEFLTTRVRGTYGGYANQQLERLISRGGNFNSDLRKRTEKHGRHCYRLILQGGNILREGEIRVRLTPSEVQACRDAGGAAVNNVERFTAAMREALAEFDATPTDLPDKPNTELVESFLVVVRLSELHDY